MNRKTLTLKLNGDVPLDLFVQAVQHFNALVDGLTTEVTGEKFPWEVADLRGGSAYVAVAAVSNDPIQVDQVLRAYDEVGELLKRNEPLPYSQAVSSPAWAIAGLINGHIKSVDLGSPFSTHTIEEPSEPATNETKKPLVAWGTIRGEAGSLLTRPNLQLTVFDSLFDRAVPCYLDKEQIDNARKAWGHQVEVTGRIYRSAMDGRPVRVRDVISIEIIRYEGDYQNARGVVPFVPGDAYPEAKVRRLRDGF